MNKFKATLIALAVVGGTVLAPTAAQAAPVHTAAACQWNLTYFSQYWGWYLSGWFFSGNRGTVCYH